MENGKLFSSKTLPVSKCSRLNQPSPEVTHFDCR